MLTSLLARSIARTARLLTGARACWLGCGPEPTQRIYFANHSSHFDFILIWSSLPLNLRSKTRPVAAADYWNQGIVRRYVIQNVFQSVLIERTVSHLHANPILPMIEALNSGHSLILFPEGTRGPGEELLPFKSGIFHLAQARADIDLVPVWTDNAWRVMPKGSVLPIPLLCSISFGKPVRLEPGEEKTAFLHRLHHCLHELRHPEPRAA